MVHNESVRSSVRRILVLLMRALGNSLGEAAWKGNMKLIIVPRCTFRSALPKMSARPKSHRAHSGCIAILAIHYKFGRILSLWLSAYFSFFLGQDATFAVIHFRWNMALCIINAQHSFAVMDSCCRVFVCPGQGSPSQNSGIHA